MFQCFRGRGSDESVKGAGAGVSLKLTRKKYFKMESAWCIVGMENRLSSCLRLSSVKWPDMIRLRYFARLPLNIFTCYPHNPPGTFIMKSQSYIHVWCLYVCSWNDDKIIVRQSKGRGCFFFPSCHCTGPLHHISVYLQTVEYILPSCLFGHHLDKLILYRIYIVFDQVNYNFTRVMLLLGYLQGNTCADRENDVKVG